MDKIRFRFRQWRAALQSGTGGPMTETQTFFRGRLIDHIQLVVADLEVSRRFYSAILEILGIPISGEGDGFFWADEFVVSEASSEAAQGVLTGRHHLAFQANDRETVDRFYKTALAHGGKDNGRPGERSYHPGYYAAFVLDPDGNNIEAVYHGEATRSTDAVRITV
jgi:catechol 2,3-dioxygenase-like lactoylglutathione lyase family enzyme